MNKIMITNTRTLCPSCLDGKISDVIKYLQTLPPDDELEVDAAMSYGEPDLCITQKSRREETDEEFEGRKKLLDKIDAQNLVKKKELYEQLKNEFGE